MYLRYHEQVEFICVYVREAHPIDGWRMTSNDRVGIAVAQPKDQKSRNAIAHQCSSVLDVKMPLYVDAIDDRVGHAYSGMPDRLYVIDSQGRVAFKSGRGPFGFKPGEMEQALLLTLLDESAAEQPPAAFKK